MPQSLAELGDPFLQAALRNQRSVRGGRNEGLTTRTLEALGRIPMGMVGAGAGLVDRAREIADQQTGNVSSLSTDYDPRRVGGELAGETALNLIGVPGLTGGVPAGAAGSAAKGIKAYHGSPHDFDRFDLSKIGTGEGAQSYGHGLYFAENEKVAKQYREALSNPGDLLFVKSKYQDARYGLHPSDTTYGSGTWRAANSVAEAGGDIEKALASSAGHSDAEALKVLQKWKSDGAEFRIQGANPGRMYEVNINAKPEQFLDWDKPLREQSHLLPNLSEAGVVPKNIEPFDADRLAKLGDWGHAQNTYLTDVGKKPGSAIYMDAGLRADGYGRDYGKAATPVLRDAGIPGIKYLDQGSRGIPQTWTLRHPQGGLSDYPTEQAAKAALAKNPELTLIPPNPQSSNYVMFDDSLVDILRKYALPGAVGAGGFGAAQSQPQQ